LKHFPNHKLPIWENGLSETEKEEISKKELNWKNFDLINGIYANKTKQT